jgi:catechol 2,3-dioxygenase-like lactoylglutathione lyase family enzyme
MTRREPGTWPAGIGAITLFVEDLAATKRFYQKTFGLPVVFEDDSSAVFRMGRVHQPSVHRIRGRADRSGAGRPS